MAGLSISGTGTQTHQYGMVSMHYGSFVAILSGTQRCWVHVYITTHSVGKNHPHILDKNHSAGLAYMAANKHCDGKRSI